MAKPKRKTKSVLKARIARPKRERKSRPKVGAKAKPATHKFTVSHAREEDYKAGGLRSHAKYRDLGISAATSGMVQAHVIRHVRAADQEEAGKLHYHVVDFQMIYVLKGWIRTAFEGEGEHTMREGACWLQPPGIVHAVRAYSDDCELLEIIIPAEFETVTLE